MTILACWCANMSVCFLVRAPIDIPSFLMAGMGTVCMRPKANDAVTVHFFHWAKCLCAPIVLGIILCWNTRKKYIGMLGCKRVQLWLLTLTRASCATIECLDLLGLHCAAFGHWPKSVGVASGNLGSPVAHSWRGWICDIVAVVTHETEVAEGTVSGWSHTFVVKK